MRWTDLSPFGWRLSLTEHPRRPGTIIYDLRQIPGARRRKKEDDQMLLDLSRQGFAGRLLSAPSGEKILCLRSQNIEPALRKALRAFIAHHFPSAQIVEQPPDAILWGASPELTEAFRRRYAQQPESRTAEPRNPDAPDDARSGGPDGRSGTAPRANGAEKTDGAVPQPLVGALLPPAAVPAGTDTASGRAGRAHGESVAAGAGTGARGDRPPVAPAPAQPAEDAGAGEDLFVPRIEDLSWDSFRPAERAEANVEVLRTLIDLRAAERPPGPAERRVLSRYAGWGSLAQVADRHATGWPVGARQALGDYLTSRFPGAQNRPASQKAQRALVSSLLNAHYTAPAVVESLWAVARSAGFAGGRVLDPAAGAGIFLGMMPQDLRLASSIDAVEIEPIAADVLRALYPEVRVHEGPFEEQSFPDDYFDLVIGNVPFANVAVYDRGKNRTYPSLHDYFLQRSLALLRPGGVGVFLTSAFTLDKVNPAARTEMGRHARLLGAVRLPVTSQTAQSGAEVVEDALVFRGLFPGEAPDTGFLGVRPAHLRRTGQSATLSPLNEQEEFLTKEEAESGEEGRVQRVNLFYWKHPERVLGTWGTTTRHGGTLTVLPDPKRDLARDIASGLGAQIAAAGGRPAPLAPQPPSSATAPQPGLLIAPLQSGDDAWGAGSLVLFGEGDEQRIVELIAPSAEHAEQWSCREVTEASSRQGRVLVEIIAIRDALRTVFRDDSDAGRLALNALYDTFVDRHGLLGAARNRRLFQTDPYAGRLLALEQTREDGAVVKSDLFTRSLALRTLPADGSVQDPKTAVLIAYSVYGTFSAEALAFVGRILDPKVRGERDESGREFLIERELLLEDPGSGALILAETYLSGFLLDRLEAARFAARTEARFAHNVRAIEAVMPAQMGPAEIIVDLGASWIPSAVVDEFLRELSGGPGGKTYTAFNRDMGWCLTEDGARLRHHIRGTERMRFDRMLQHLLNREPMLVYDKDPDSDKRTINRPETQAAEARAEEIRAAFRAFLWQDEARSQELCDLYNRQFNSYCPPQYVQPAEAPPPPGMSPSITLYPTQNNMTLRGLSERRGIIAHDVGMGKTLTQVVLAHEMVRLGFAMRPMIVVKKATLAQFASTAQQAFPGANYLVMTNADLHKERRARFLARALTQRFDAIIVTHETFRALSVSREAMRDALTEEICRAQASLEWMKENRIERFTSKRIAKKLSRLEAQLASVDGDRTESITIDTDLGIDCLMVDEAHLYKNDDSARSIDLQSKARVVRAVRRDDYGVFLSTATPVSNSLNEIHRMMGYVAPDLLDRANIGSIETFRSVFVGTRANWEPHHAGAGWTLKSRDSLINVPEAIRMLLAVMDRRTVAKDAAGVIRVPEKNVHTVEVLMTDLQQAVMEDIADRAMHAGGTDGKDHVFSLMDRAAKCSCDVRLLDAAEESVVDPRNLSMREHGSKLPAICETVKKVYEETAPVRGAQMVFLDMGVPGGVSGIDLYEDLTSMLEAQGIPRGEIAAIHEASTDEARAILFDRVNLGAVRVLLGSTMKMSEGVNAQERLAAVHIVNPPWRPDIVEQTIGRGVRQGNLHDSVGVYFYASVSRSGAVSPDAFRYQLLQVKIRMFASLLSGEYSQRAFDPDVSMTMGEIAATASGNPLVMEKFKHEAAVATAEAHMRFLLSERQRLRGRAAQAEYLQQVSRAHLTLLDALPVEPSPEVWFSCDEEGTPLAEIGDRTAVNRFLRERPRSGPRSFPLHYRNVPVLVNDYGDRLDLGVRLARPVADPVDTRRQMSVLHFSSVDMLVKRLSREHAEAARAQHQQDLDRSAQARAVPLAEVDEINDRRIPAAQEAIAGARQALAEIENRLLDSERPDLVRGSDDEEDDGLSAAAARRR